MKEIERQLRINENVIRALTVRVDELTAAPSVMMQQQRGDDRPAIAEAEEEIAVTEETK